MLHEAQNRFIWSSNWIFAHVFLAFVSKDNRSNQDFEQEKDKPYGYVTMNGSFMRPGKYQLILDITDNKNDRTGTIKVKDAKGRVLSIADGVGLMSGRINIREDVSYKLAICMTAKDAKITLIDF